MLVHTNLQRKNILAKKIGRNVLVNWRWEPAQSAYWLKSLRKPKTVFTSVKFLLLCFGLWQRWFKQHMKR